MATVSVTAPVRICDCGGWTDTWFAPRGAVLHITVLPGVTVQAAAEPGPEKVSVQLGNYGESYEYERARPPGCHPIIEAAVAEYPVPESTLSVDVRSEMPPGASTGTSAAVAVAVIAALLKCRRESATATELARAAHRVETARLGLEAGIQDQIAAAYGGINFIEVIGYPEAIVTQLTPAADVHRRLEAQLLLVYLGRAHRSSDVHEAVISRLHEAGGSAIALDRLHDAAVAARDALVAADLPAFGRALRHTVEAQAALHPSVVTSDARLVGALADASGALGWKVNGAGGDGGSVSVLLGEDPSARRALSLRLMQALPAARILPIRLARVGAAVPLV